MAKNELNIMNRQTLLFVLLGAFFLIVGLRLEAIRAFADSMPYWDDFTVGHLLFFYESDTMDLYHLIKPANEHRIFFSRLLTLLSFELNQHQWDPKVSMMASTLIWAFSGVFLARIVINNLPIARAFPPLAIIAATWFIPFSLVNIVWGVQTHTYIMILLIIAGCWWTTEPALSKPWWFGLIALASASLTLAGGTFAAFSVFSIAMLMLIRNGFKDKHELATVMGSLIAGIVGLSLILTQPNVASVDAQLSFYDAFLTFTKTLSWPLVHLTWPSIAFIAPVAILLVQTFVNPQKMTRLARFTLTVYLAIFIIVLAIAYARGTGMGPARRYFDYLALMPVMSLLALYQIETTGTRVLKGVVKLLAVAIIAILAWSVPWLNYAFDYTVKDQKQLKTTHEVNVMSYMNTWNDKWLLNKGFRGVPFPRPNDLAKLLKDYNDLDMLPYQLQTRQHVFPDHRLSAQEQAASVFVQDGTALPSQKIYGVRPFGEPVLGSYVQDSGGAAATGTFLSNEFHHNRDYIALQVLGDYGESDLTLKFVEFGSGKEYELKRPKISKYAEREQWRYVLQALPKGYYQIVAEDNSEKHWFGFATPKSVGRLSYQVERLISHSKWVWLLGVLLMLFGLRNYLIPKRIEN